MTRSWKRRSLASRCLSSLPDLLLEKFSIVEKMVDENCSEQQQKKKNEDIDKGKNDADIFFPFKNTDDLVTVLDFC